MTKHLKNVFDGFASMLRVYPSRDYIIPDKNGFKSDYAALRGDAQKFATDLRKKVAEAPWQG